MLKKISFVIVLVLSSSLFAQEVEKSDFYFGLDVFSGKTAYERTHSGFNAASQVDIDKDYDQDGFRLKFGAVLNDGWRVQGYLQGEDLENFDNNVIGIGVDVIKGFEVTPKFQPFLLGGIGVHTTELEDKNGVIYDDDYVSAFSLKLGLGAMYQFNETFELVGGFDWQFRSWSDMDAITINNGQVEAYTIEQEDISKTVYLGINIHF